MALLCNRNPLFELTRLFIILAIISDILASIWINDNFIKGFSCSQQICIGNQNAELDRYVNNTCNNWIAFSHIDKTLHVPCKMKLFPCELHLPFETLSCMLLISSLGRTQYIKSANNYWQLSPYWDYLAYCHYKLNECFISWWMHVVFWDQQTIHIPFIVLVVVIRLPPKMWGGSDEYGRR